MLNGEHYHDPTASKAVGKVSRRQQNANRNRTLYNTTPAYVTPKFRSVRFPHESIDVEEMDMTELKPYIASCAKSQMDPMKCIDCNPGCVFGRRAIEIMEKETRPTEPKKVNRGTITMRQKAIKEYQAAIDSGDVLKYALEHAKSKDPKKAKAAAAARVAFWRKNYGMLIKENPAPEKDPVPVEKIIEEVPEEQPHLMQMPCLSKKVAAEREAAAKVAEENSNITKVFTAKLNALKDSLVEIQRQMDELKSNKDSIEDQIRTIEATAGMLNVAIA